MPTLEKIEQQGQAIAALGSHVEKLMARLSAMEAPGAPAPAPSRAAAVEIPAEAAPPPTGGLSQLLATLKLLGVGGGADARPNLGIDTEAIDRLVGLKSALDRLFVLTPEQRLLNKIGANVLDRAAKGMGAKEANELIAGVTSLEADS